MAACLSCQAHPTQLCSPNWGVFCQSSPLAFPFHSGAYKAAGGYKVSGIPPLDGLPAMAYEKPSFRFEVWSDLT